MSFARLAVPPVAGAATSLALLYLYHQATLSRHDALQDAIEQTRESVENAEHRIRDKFSGKPSSGVAGPAGEQGQAESSFALGGRSRYQEKRYKSIAEEIKERWNVSARSLPGEKQLECATRPLGSLRPTLWPCSPAHPPLTCPPHSTTCCISPRPSRA